MTAVSGRCIQQQPTIIAIIRCMPWWRHLVSDCEVKSRTLAPSVWQPTPSALNLLFLSCVTGVYECVHYDHCMLVERSVLTAIKTIIITVIIIITESSHCHLAGRAEQRTAAIGRLLAAYMHIQRSNRHRSILVI